jgi:MFS-type transporter involved in bile tolerance (Atg22 family)
MSRSSYLQYIRKSAFWFVGNLAIGCCPLIFLSMVFMTSRGKMGYDDFDKQVHEGAILFVCVAMIGGIMLDFLQSEFRLRGRQIVIIVITPIMAISLLFLEYLFVILKIINSDCFNITSRSTIFVVLFSAIYCILNKTNLLIMEDTSHE